MNLFFKKLQSFYIHCPDFNDFEIIIKHNIKYTLSNGPGSIIEFGKFENEEFDYVFLEILN